MERIGDEVARELARQGPQGAMGGLLEAWPDAVGPQIARNAWPARVGRDGTLHVHTADAIWAFELGHRAAEIAGRLGVPGVRFAPGPLPAAVEQEPAEGSAPQPVEVSSEDAARAAEIASAVADEALRDRIARAAALSLARAAREA